MTPLTIRNALGYVLLWALNALIADLAIQVGIGAVWGFQAGQVFAPHAAEVASALALIGSGLAFWLSAHRPALGREDVAALVGQIGTFDALAVLRDVLHGRSQSPPPLTDDELARMADHVYERIAARMLGAPSKGALVSKPPAWLPETGSGSIQARG